LKSAPVTRMPAQGAGFVVDSALSVTYGPAPKQNSECAMPLSPPQPRQHFHTRAIDCKGYLRDDGLWDIEGHLEDHKSYGYESRWRGQVQPYENIHDMWIRLTVDETFTVKDVEAVTDGSPYGACGKIVGNYRDIIGLRIGAGWVGAVRDKVGGIKGCTHQMEILKVLATAAYQTIGSAKARKLREQQGDSERHWGKVWKFLINSCYAWSSTGDIVKQEFPEKYRGSN